MPPLPETNEGRSDWHRLFGLLLIGHLEGSPFTVELEKDLSLRQQFLDVVVVRRGPGRMRRSLPDGLSDFVTHNLLTFKSHQEPLTDWTLKELTGHYVNYRKWMNLEGTLLPEKEFGLYAICARRPRTLFRQLSPEQIQAGVYRLRRGSDVIRIVVAAELPLTKANSLLHLFSAAADRVQYGQAHYQLPTPEISTIIKELFVQYQAEGLVMPYTMNDFRKKVAREVLDQLTPEERLRGLPPEERMADLSSEEIQAYLDTRRDKSLAKKSKSVKKR